MARLRILYMKVGSFRYYGSFQLYHINKSLTLIKMREESQQEVLLCHHYTYVLEGNKKERPANYMNF